MCTLHTTSPPPPPQYAHTPTWYRNVRTTSLSISSGGWNTAFSSSVSESQFSDVLAVLRLGGGERGVSVREGDWLVVWHPWCTYACACARAHRKSHAAAYPAHSGPVAQHACTHLHQHVTPLSLAVLQPTCYSHRASCDPRTRAPLPQSPHLLHGKLATACYCLLWHPIPASAHLRLRLLPPSLGRPVGAAAAGSAAAVSAVAAEPPAVAAVAAAGPAGFPGVLLPA